MKIISLTVGFLQANCYFVTKANQTLIIDPGDDYEKIIEIGDSLNIVGILVTHHHFDHVGALKKVESHYQLKHNQYQDLDMEIIKTPGHSKDSLSFYFPKEKILFSGDFIFKNNIGRCDLEGGDEKKMQTSIKKILTYPKEIQIYPGHGESTTLKKEESFLQKFL